MDARFDKAEERLDRIENLLLADHKRRIEKLEAEVKELKNALALSRQTGIPLKAFKCAWFDDRDYFEFFPLSAVYPRR